MYLVVVVGHSHALATPTGRGLEHDWVAHLAGQLHGVLLVLDLTLVAGDHEAARLLGNALAAQLVSLMVVVSAV